MQIHDDRDVFQATDRRTARDRYSQPLSGAGRDPRMSGNCQRGRGLRRREKNATEAGAGRFEKPAPDTRAAPPEAHESLIGRKTVEDVLLTGLSFFLQTLGPEKWRSALSKSGLDPTSFSAGLVYEDRQALELTVLAAETLNVPVDELVEMFGTFLSTELIRLYHRVIKPHWRTLDIIENTETFIHSAVRVGNPCAVPPVLDAIRLSENELQLLYSSDRKLCKLALGIIKGLADPFQEVIEIHKDSCMLHGDPFCTFRFIKNLARHDTEQASGGSIDQQAAFFSLGCALYDLATAQRPFDCQNILSTLSALANHIPKNPVALWPDCPAGFAELKTARKSQVDSRRLWKVFPDKPLGWIGCLR